MEKRKILEKAKIKTIEKFYFLSYLLAVIRFQENQKVFYGATDGLNVFLNFENLRKLSANELGFVLSHELFHILLQHFERFKKLSKQNQVLWNLATDLVINEALLKSFSISNNLKDKIATFDGLIKRLPEYHIFIEGLKNKNAEEVYKFLLNLKREGIIQINENKANINGFKWECDLKEGNEKNKNSGNHGKNGTKNGRDNDKRNSNEIKEIEEQLKKAINKAIQSMRLRGIGVGGLEQLLEGFYKPKVNWKNLLRKYLSEELMKITTYSRIHKKKSALFDYSIVYAGYKKEFGNLKATIIIDTSGSINDSELAQFFSEIYDILKQFQAEIKLIQHDWSIQRIDIIKKKEELLKVTIKGRGGTSHKEVINYLIKNNNSLDKQKHIIIFLSDYYSDLEEEQMKEIEKRYRKVFYFNEELKMVDKNYVLKRAY